MNCVVPRGSVNPCISNVTPDGELHVLLHRARNTQVHFSDVAKNAFPFDLVIWVAPFTPDECFSRQLGNPVGRGKMVLAMIRDSGAT